MVIMSVDYGDVRTGLAVCDRLELLATPVRVITERSQGQLIIQIAALAAKKKVERFVVGYPKNMDASEGERAQKCAAFAITLGEQTGLPVDLWDERLTTVSAYQILHAAEVPGKKNRQIVDSVAAVLILQDFLDWRKNQKENSEDGL